MSFERICRLQQLKDEGIDGVTPCEKDCNLAAMLGYFNIPKESCNVMRQPGSSIL